MEAQLLKKRNRGLLFIISAPAGTGKTTLVQMLNHEFPSIIANISYTTRPPREGEIEGVHYHFITEEAFLQRLKDGDFLEYVKLYGWYYGTSKSSVEKQLAKNKHVVLVIDTKGAAQLKKLVEAIMIFIMPPSLEDLRLRLTNRNTESLINIEKRLQIAEQEMQCHIHYDYCVINDDLMQCYQILRSIFIAEEHRIR